MQSDITPRHSKRACWSYGMRIIDPDDVASIRRRPWWAIPGLAGVLVGGAIGFTLLPTPLPPCSPADAPSELVVQRFLERLGSSAASIQECWSPGKPTRDELETYVGARPPKTISLTSHSVGQGGGRVLIQWHTVLTWSDRPPEGWHTDEPRLITLIRHDGPTRWTIEATDAPRRP
jgi:hypothetical protein